METQGRHKAALDTLLTLRFQSFKSSVSDLGWYTTATPRYRMLRAPRQGRVPLTLTLREDVWCCWMIVAWGGNMTQKQYRTLTRRVDAGVRPR